jgi:hypothetical protein
MSIQQEEISRKLKKIFFKAKQEETRKKKNKKIRLSHTSFHAKEAI